VQLGGRLGHEDNPKGDKPGGSVFWLDLPLAAPGVAMATARALNAPEAASMPVLALRVLIVHDVEMNRDIAASFIRAAGDNDVCCAEGGSEAVAAVAAGDFDIVLMDMRMPEVDGLMATRRIRALPAPRGLVPIVALTANAFTEQIEECHKAGMDGHLAKPFTMPTLLAALAHGLAAGQRRGVVMSQPSTCSAELNG